MTAIGVTDAGWGYRFKFERITGSQVRLRNTTTGEGQAIDIAALADQAGAKTRSFSQLGIHISLNGAIQSGVDKLASAINNKNVTKAAPDYSIKLTHVGTGASQTISMNGIGESSATRVLQFSALDVSFTLTGGSGSTASLVNGLHGKDIRTKELVTEYVNGYEVEVVTEEEQEVVTIFETSYESEHIVEVTEEFLLAVQHGRAREYDLVTAQQSPAARATGDALSEFRALDAAVEKRLTEIQERRDVIQREIEQLARGEQLDAQGAKALAESVLRDALKLTARMAAWMARSSPRSSRRVLRARRSRR
ncbi:MAG: hypothetical protein FJZ92_03910 [Chloroflexi bacterium]|nr:hypothetical protein [Chloroflexota bacterium]